MLKGLGFRGFAGSKGGWVNLGFRCCFEAGESKLPTGSEVSCE